MATLLVLLLCVAAFAGLAMAMQHHQKTVFGRALSRAASRVLQCAGWLGLLAALGLVVAARGWAFGLVYYSGCTSLAAGAVYIALIAGERRSMTR